MIYGALFLFLVLPVMLLGAYSYRQAWDSLTAAALDRRSSIAYLAVKTLQEKFDRLTDLGVSFATRVRFRQLVAEGRWTEAVDILKLVPSDFPFIERVFLADPAGTLMADAPELPGVRGQNFSQRDWYQGVRREWHPYVSEVYQRAARPQYNVVAVAAPITDDAQKVVGILVMQVRLDTFFDWAKQINVGPAGFIFFVDPRGHIVGHPRFSSQATIADFSGTPVVQKVLRGERGIELAADPAVTEDAEEQVAAYEPVPAYGWGVIVMQPAATVFAARDSELRRAATVFGLIFFFGGLFAFVTIRLLAVVGALRRKERIVLDSIGDGIIAIDRFWTVIRWNRAASVITGWSEQEALGRSLRQVFRPIREHDRVENIDFIEHALVTGETGYLENDTILIRKDGREVPVGDSASPVFNAAGKVVGAIIIFRDVTQEREYDLLKSDFAYTSHQLRTPLSKTVWAIETALEAVGLEQAKNILRGAAQAAKSLTKTVNQIVAMSEVDRGLVVPRPAAARIDRIIDEAIRIARERLNLKNDVFEIVPSARPSDIETDAGLLSKALAEVLENAILYGSGTGRVQIRLLVQSRDVVIEVGNAGLGIAERDQPLVFHKFFRGSNIDTTEIPGAGLGLYLSSSYLKLLRGKIWFQSGERRGATFFISLPLSSPDEE